MQIELARFVRTAKQFSAKSNKLSAALPLLLAQVFQGRAENQASYRFENYQEDGHRISVETHSALFEFQPKSWLTFQGEVVYDAISGASPTGAPPPSTIHFEPDENGNPPPGANSTSVPVADLHDIRWAGSMSTVLSFRQNRLTPQFSYSEEHDYKSYGAALNYSLDLNEKNTTLNLGWAHNWDQVLFRGSWLNKEADDFIVGVNQLLGPKTVLTANLSYGHQRGFLNDQYKKVLFDNFSVDDPIPQGLPENPSGFPEHRPRQRDKYLAFLSLTQDITPLHAAIEGSYRYMYDSFEVSAHALQVSWLQKLGQHVVVTPFFRYYIQSAASFYYVRLPYYDTRPDYYSADYRLSEMETWTGGVSVTWKVREWLSLDATYKRYAMHGLDGVTSQTAYPSANIFTIGARIWF
jgi:hypothetical protein